jgi:8-amino-7-oxononanoate synthase
MPPATDPLTVLRAAQAARAQAGVSRRLRPRPADGDGLTDLASNDYLGLCQDPRVTESAAQAARAWGAGATGSRLVTGSTDLHTRLESGLAEFTGAAAALVFSSGYLANLATVTALAAALQFADQQPTRSGQPGAGWHPGAEGRTPWTPRPARASSPPGALIVSDAANHASLVDACRLARARVEIVPHLDAGAAERALAGRSEPAALIVTESAFSLGGPLAPVAALHRAARAQGALLVIDEAHALGVAGPGGRGVARAAGIACEPDVILTLTLSKALGAQGGAVLGAREVIDTLIDSARPFIFDTGLAPASTAAALCALQALAAQPCLAERARGNAARLAALAEGAGLPVEQPHAAVVTVTIGDPARALAAQQTCLRHGARVGCFRPPSVAPGRSCLRLTARATMTEADFAVAARALAAVRDELRPPAPAGQSRS